MVDEVTGESGPSGVDCWHDHASAAGASTIRSGWRMSEPVSTLEGNKAAVRRFKESQGTSDEAAAMREVLAPGYTRLRGGMANLASNAHDQGFPAPGAFLRDAFPDRVDVIEDIIAEEDRVGMLWRLTGTHKGNLFGIPPTGRKVDIHEIGWFRLAD